VEPLAAVCLEECLRPSKPIWRLRLSLRKQARDRELSGSLLGKPKASAQAGGVKPKPEDLSAKF